MSKKTESNFEVNNNDFDLIEIMEMSLASFSEWLNEEDEIYNEL